MGERINIALICEVCSSRNYQTTRKPTQQGQLKLKKHCPTCNKHTLHLETK
jgi:large subunit ribosomal protein L33